MIKQALPIVLLASALIGARGLPLDTQAAPKPTLKNSLPARTGIAIFKANKCSQCHAIESQGILRQGKLPAAGKLATDLSDVGSKHNADWIVRWLKKHEEINGKKHAIKFSSSDNDLRTLTAWLESLKAIRPSLTSNDTSVRTNVAKSKDVTTTTVVKTTETTTTKEVTTIKDVPVVKETPVKKPTTLRVSAGAVIFEGQKCAKCHSVSSQGIERLGAAPSGGGKLPPDLSGVGLRHTSEWMQGWLKKEEEMNGKKHMKLFTGPDQDLKTLTSWLASLKKG